MNKIILYGAGKTFWDNAYKFDIHEVLCIADKNAFLTPLFGCDIIRPERILDYDFDYIVIFNKRNCDEIKKELIILGVEPKKIVSWSYYLYVIKYGLADISEECKSGLEEWLRTINQKISVLDINQGFVKNCFHIKKNNIYKYIKKIDNITFEETPIINKSYYSNMFQALDNNSGYDAIFCFDFFLKHSFELFLNFYKRTYELSRYLIISIPYNGFHLNDNSWDNFKLPSGRIVFEREYRAVKLLIIEKEKKHHFDDACIYVVTHKEFIPPQNSLYKPIFAGSDNNNIMHIQGDKEGDNISFLNPLINECTVLYWIWKHSKEKYVGLNHYRRYFSMDNKANYEGLLTYNQVIELLKSNDMIVAPAYNAFPYSLKYQIECSIDKKVFDQGWKIIRGIIKKKYPGYLKDFDEYFNGHFMYPCNMFITKRQVLNKYCKWLFDILIDACLQIKLKKADHYSSRIIGFMAERLMTLWILHNNIKVTEIEMVLIE